MVLKIDLKELLYRLTHLVEVKSFAKTSDGNGLVALSATDFDVTKPFFIVRNTGGYASIPYSLGGTAYFRLTDFQGNNMINSPTTCIIVVLNIGGGTP